MALVIPTDTGDSNAEQQKSAEVASAPKTKAPISAKALALGVRVFCFFVVLVPMSYKMPAVVVEKGIGTATDAAMIYTVFTLVGVPVSIVFGTLKKHLGTWLLPVSFSCEALGYLLFTNASSIVMAYVAGIIVGTGFATTVPYFYNLVAEISTPENMNLNNTIVLLACNFGVSSSTFIMNGVGNALFGTAATSVTMLSAIAFCALFGLGIAIALFERKGAKA